MCENGVVEDLMLADVILKGELGNRCGCVVALYGILHGVSEGVTVVWRNQNETAADHFRQGCIVRGNDWFVYGACLGGCETEALGKGWNADAVGGGNPVRQFFTGNRRMKQGFFCET